MGAYENVPILHEGTSAAGQAWANAAASAGANIAKGIIARRENIRKRQEEENAKGLENMRALATSKIETEQWRQKIEKQLTPAGMTTMTEGFKNSIMEAKLQVVNIPKMIKNATAAEIPALEEAMAHYQGLLSSSMEYITAANSTYGGWRQAIDIAADSEGNIGGEWDQYNVHNNKISRAVRIMEGKGEKNDKFEEVLKDGKRYHKFTWTEDGEAKTLIVDPTDPPEVEYVPDVQKQIDKVIGEAGFVAQVDGKDVPNDKYILKSADGKSLESKRTATAADGTVNTIISKEIDEFSLVRDAVHVASPIFTDLEPNQKISVMKNQLAHLYIKGADGEFLNTWLPEELQAKMKKHTLKSFTYSESGEMTMTPEQEEFASELFASKYANETLQKYKSAIGETKVSSKEPRYVRGRGYPKIIGVSRTANGKGYMIDYDNNGIKTSGFVIELNPEMQAIFDKANKENDSHIKSKEVNRNPSPNQ